MALKETLRTLDFNDKEIVVYTALLKLGRLTPAELAKHTKINRATIYNIAKSLQNKGVIADDLSGKTLYFTPLPVSSLREVVERPLRELEERRDVATRAVEEASMIAPQETYPVPGIRFIEEHELETFFYTNIAKWVQSIRSVDNAWWGIQDSTWLEHFANFNDWYWKNPISKGIKMNLLGNQSVVEQKTAEKHLTPLRHVHLTPDTLFTSSVWVGGDYLIMIVTRQHPFYAVEIHDKTLSHNMRETFKKLWTDSMNN